MYLRRSSIIDEHTQGVVNIWEASYVRFAEWEYASSRPAREYIYQPALLHWKAGLHTVLMFEERVVVRLDPVALDGDEATPPARPQGGHQPNFKYI
jgi:hypothetical protein